MTQFTLHSIESAPEESKALLADSLKTIGMIPNLHAVMAEAPGLLDGYKYMTSLVQKSSFNAEEVTVLWQTINVEHGCHYCVPAHTAIAHMMKVDTQLIDALRNAEPLKNPKLQALHEMILAIVRQRGQVKQEQVDSFFSAGYQKQQLLEIVLGVSHKIMSNYVNHMAETPLDEAFLPFAWEKPAQ
ncbi:MAG: carboxymuconolactone decarboxylase [Gammaproteobacteria bacterium CG22_combo_CG10-13_8_21_14_all_40_8]|nr:MAG: carboxymuconolactone decarboxylase [Gammaproteobacteria bacterium CG22_combo_CG10-13_8_21_14_all_40_8]